MASQFCFTILSATGQGLSVKNCLISSARSSETNPLVDTWGGRGKVRRGREGRGKVEEGEGGREGRGKVEEGEGGREGRGKVEEGEIGDKMWV